MKKIVLLLGLLSSLGFADSFVAGSKSIGITVGSGSVSYNGGLLVGTNVENYFIVGISADYFIIDDLAVGLGYQGWFGGTPSIQQVSLPVTYYVPTQTKYRPYFGAFYRYTYINSDSYDNYSSVGGRAGVAVLFQNGYAGLGWVQEVYLNGDSTSDSTSGYPEAVIGFSF